VDTHWTLTRGGYGVAAGVGVAVFAVGFLLFARCVRLFAEAGEGTLAPWDPPRKLVVVGPYQYVRNPMISSVIVMLLGEATIFGSGLLLGLAGFIFAVNTVYFMLSEEPGLERRFGEDYRQYKKNVRRWMPRRTAWTELDGATRTTHQ
jgi:protein-S-isoprenylcysteine O-methyltransferase Ste14